MANYFYNDTQSATADGAVLKTLAASDSITFGASAVWSSTGAGGAALALAANDIATINGQLYGDTGIVVGGRSNITIGDRGIVSGFNRGIDAHGAAADIYNYGFVSGTVAIDAGTSSRIYNVGNIAGLSKGLQVSLNVVFDLINDGTISGYTAVDLEGNQPFSIENAGSISSSGYAIHAYSTYDGTLSNSGTIIGVIDFEAAEGGSIVNSGTITGDVDLYFGDDTFDSSDGHLHGRVFGGSGDDVLTGSLDADYLDGGDGYDELRGGVGADTLVGGAGGDLLDGGDGVDVVSYSVAPPPDSIGVTVDLVSPGLNTGDAAGDTYTSIEGISGSDYNDKLYGDAGANHLNGSGGDDMLYGRGGGDVMRGGYGNDTYYVDSSADRVIEKVAGNGTDTVVSTASDYTLTDNVENLTLGGGAAISGHGNALDNDLTGNGAANALYGGDGMDTLDGGRGADMLAGGAGWDTYYVDNSGDTVTEVPDDSNSDTIHATVNYTLPANVEILFLDGAHAINGVGNAANNLVVGNDARNIIDGGLGNDQLSGGGGADGFAFSTTLNAATNLDTVFDFTSGKDTLQLSKSVFQAISGTAGLSAGQFYTGTAAHDANDHIIYDNTTGNVFYDPDGNGAQAQVQFAILSHALLQPIPTLVASDIQLVG